METEPPKAEPLKRKRRWLQFRLRSLLIVVALLAIPCGYVGWHAKIVRERKAMASTLVADLDYKPSPWIRRWLGDESYGLLYLNSSASDEDVDRCRHVFPESKVMRLHLNIKVWDEWLPLEPQVDPAPATESTDNTGP